MRQAVRQTPGDDIAGLVVLGIHRDGQAFAVTGEKGLQVRHAAVVNVAVGTAQTP